MKPAEFLTLIGAPWAAYHDHPHERGIAYIRPVSKSMYDCEDACAIYNTDSDIENFGTMRRASRDLIAKAPDLYAYVARMAETGDTEARMLLKSIHGEPL